MTETVAALGALSKSGIVSDDPASDTMASTRHYAFGGFLETWRDDANVSCTYLGLVAGLSASASPGVAALVKRSGEKNVALANVRAVSENHDSEFHGVYDAKVPNKFYALIGGFARSNVMGFHALDGRGYDFVVAKLLEMDKINAIAASRLAKPFTDWRLYDPRRASLMRACLEKILAAKPSPNMFEICTKSLAAE
jgi:aminopeptidase N